MHVSAVHQGFPVVEKSTAESVDKTGKNDNKKGKFHSILDSKNKQTDHEAEKQYLCDNCAKDFVKDNSLNESSKLFPLGRVNPYKCNLCINSATHVKNVQERKKEHYCNECNAKFLEESDLKEHVLVVHDGKKEFMCSVCESCFKEENELKIHIHQIHRVQQYTCNIDFCNAKFSRKLSLESHIQKIHRATKKQPEATIVKITCEIGSLKCLACEENIRPYKCSLCNNRYSHQESLQKHFDEAHNVEFRNKDSLLNHASEHIQKNMKRNFPVQDQKDDQERTLLLPTKKPKIQEDQDILLEVYEEKSPGKVLEGYKPAFDRDLCSKSFVQEWSLTKHNSASHKLRADSKVHEEKTHSEVLEEKNHGNYLEENKPTKGQ